MPGRRDLLFVLLLFLNSQPHRHRLAASRVKGAVVQQLELFPEPNLSPAPRWRDAVFFAVRMSHLGEQASGIVQSLRRDAGITGPARPARTLHISLRGAGYGDRLGADDLDALRAAASSLRPPCFGIRLDRVMTLGARGRAIPRPLVLAVGDGAAGLTALADALGGAAIRRGTRLHGGSLSLPHLTLLYDRITVPPTPLATALATEITGFELILSHRGQSRYTTLWP